MHSFPLPLIFTQTTPFFARIMKSNFYFRFVESLSVINSMFYFSSHNIFVQLSQKRLAKNGELQLKKWNYELMTKVGTIRLSNDEKWFEEQKNFKFYNSACFTLQTQNETQKIAYVLPAACRETRKRTKNAIWFTNKMILRNNWRKCSVTDI